MTRVLTIVLFLCSALAVWAQESNSIRPSYASSSSAGEESSSGASPNTPWLPIGVNGEVGSLAFSSETGRTNLMYAGLGVSSGYDDNALSNNADKIGNVSYQVFPSIGFHETRTRSIWNLNYNPGFTFNQRLPQKRDYSHNLDFGLQYRLTERLTLRLHDNFNAETTLYDQFSTSPLLQPGNPLTQLNPSIITPLARRLSNAADIDFIYRIGPDTIAGASGSFAHLQFDNQIAGSGTPLLNTNAGTANGYYYHRITGGHWAGVRYGFQRIITTGQFTEGTNVQSIQLFYTYAPNQHLSFSVFAGPDHNVTNEHYFLFIGPYVFPVSNTHDRWLVDGGATFGWQGTRTSIQGSLIRHVTDGGGLTGAVRSHMASFSARRHLTDPLVVDAGVAYASNDSLGTVNASAVNTISGIAGVERNFGDHFSISLGYARDHQNYTASGSSPSLPADHNRYWLSLSYHFSRVLGR